jgi:uncharacterized membrane protein YqgA involved in biofilm formation
MLLDSRKGRGAKKYVERKLLRRLRLFFLIFFLLGLAIIYEINWKNIHWSVCVGAMLIGLMIGAAFVRRKKIYWHEETSTVIAKMDRVGIYVLVIYVVFIIVRHYFLHQWFKGNELTAFSLSLTAGAMVGRLLSIRSEIRQILKERNLI